MSVQKSTLRLRLDPRDPELSRLREIARGSREGKLVAFPTETVYGMGLPMSSPDAAGRLARLKRRPLEKAFAYHIADWTMLEFLNVASTPSLRFLTHRFWPGPLTLIVKDGRGEKMGLRFPNHLLATALINTVGEPFVATSANLSGQPSAKTADEVLKAFDGQIDYVIDGGPCEYGEDSTVVDLSSEKPAVIREGAKAEEIQEAVTRIREGKYPRKRILLVCTGNSCRTPMAAGWLERELAAKKLSEEIEVSTCGIVARSGRPPTAEAAYVMQNREIDISEHRSRPCTREDVMNSDLIIAMSEDHTLFITGMVPSAKGKIRTLNVQDPIGMGMIFYEEVFQGIEKKLKEMWSELVA